MRAKYNTGTQAPYNTNITESNRPEPPDGTGIWHVLKIKNSRIFFVGIGIGPRAAFF
jgi:hypothetical protein